MTVVRLAEESEQDLLHRIDQFYLYEFSKFMPGYYKLDADGVFQDGDYLDYWSDPNRYPYLIEQDNELAGFSLVRSHEGCHNLDQFFVMLKFQGTGTAQRAAIQTFEHHPGSWELHSLKNNAKSEAFWPRLIAEYTSGNYERYSLPPKHTHFAYTFSTITR